jgi:hypothetical protein
VRVKPKSMTWLWFLNIPLAIFVLLVFVGSTDPNASAKAHDRDVYELCLSQLKDPDTDPGAKALIVRPVCDRQRKDFIEKYGREP